MNTDNLLLEFEKKYPFLYEITVGGVPIYTCHRNAVLGQLQKKGSEKAASFVEEKDRVFVRRLLDSAAKILRFRKSKTLVFTSSMFRRDEGRNLAAEYLMEQYPEAVVFEWPNRTEAYDAAYFSDPQKDKYCPLDFYLVLYKLYRWLFRRKYNRLAQQCRDRLAKLFSEIPATADEKAAIRYLMEKLPVSYAETACSHTVFRLLFGGYKNVKYAVDFWGSARENIIPVLPGEPESVELQHGVITTYHPGYIYPEFLKNCETKFFKRTLLVYGEKTKQMLTRNSIFSEDQIRVIGNPRIKMYKKRYPVQDTERKLILFTSQPYEQDGAATGYYCTVIDYLRAFEEVLKTDPRWAGYELAIKLHPRENNGVVDVYRKALPSVAVYDNATQLYQLLSSSILQITVSSTSLYEAAEFDTPTVVLAFANENHKEIYGFMPWLTKSPQEVRDMMEAVGNPADNAKYLAYLKEMSAHYN